MERNLLVARHRGFLEFVGKSLVLLVFFRRLHALLLVLLWACHVLVVSLVGQGLVLSCAFFVAVQLLRVHQLFAPNVGLVHLGFHRLKAAPVESILGPSFGNLESLVKGPGLPRNVLVEVETLDLAGGGVVEDILVQSQVFEVALLGVRQNLRGFYPIKFESCILLMNLSHNELFEKGKLVEQSLFKVLLDVNIVPSELHIAAIFLRLSIIQYLFLPIFRLLGILFTFLLVWVLWIKFKQPPEHVNYHGDLEFVVHQLVFGEDDVVEDVLCQYVNLVVFDSLLVELRLRLIQLLKEQNEFLLHLSGFPYSLYISRFQNEGCDFATFDKLVFDILDGKAFAVLFLGHLRGVDQAVLDINRFWRNISANTWGIGRN